MGVVGYSGFGLAIRVIAVVGLAGALAACGHSEVKAPCGPVASLTDDCGPEKLLNPEHVFSFGGL